MTPDARDRVVMSAHLDIDAQLFSALTVGGSRGDRIFDVAPAGTAERMPDLRATGEASYRGFRLLTFDHTATGDPTRAAEAGGSGASAMPAFTMMVCQGEHHEISTTYAAGARFEVFEEFLSQFDIADGASGLTLTPQSDRRLTVRTRSLFSMVDDVCALVTYFQPSNVSLPATPGRKVRGGELWRLPDRGRLLLGAKTAVTEIVPFEADPATARAAVPAQDRARTLMQLAEGLQVELAAR